MSVVLDASFAVDLIVAQDAAELQPTARAISQEVLTAPAFFWYEVASGLRNMHLPRRITSGARGPALQRLRTFRIRLDEDAPFVEDVLAVSDRFQLTIYDAAYLELALRTRSSLATRDKALIAAAPEAGVELAR